MTTLTHRLMCIITFFRVTQWPLRHYRVSSIPSNHGPYALCLSTNWTTTNSALASWLYGAKVRRWSLTYQYVFTIEPMRYWTNFRTIDIARNATRRYQPSAYMYPYIHVPHQNMLLEPSKIQQKHAWKVVNVHDCIVIITNALMTNRYDKQTTCCY